MSYNESFHEGFMSFLSPIWGGLFSVSYFNPSYTTRHPQSKGGGKQSVLAAGTSLFNRPAYELPFYD